MRVSDRHDRFQAAPRGLIAFVAAVLMLMAATALCAAPAKDNSISDLRPYSMLYIKAVPNDPNLNGDLYQCSLTGTNSTRLLASVSDYYPQDKGIVIAKRRTSRSGHELLYFKAGQKQQPVVLRSAMDFGEVAVNEAQSKWAGFVKPGLGVYWNVVVASLAPRAKEDMVLPLPEGARPGEIAWSGDKLMIKVQNDDRMRCYETIPTAASPEWKPVSPFSFPGALDFVLDKSETLTVDQVMENGKPVVEVAIVWFTGDRISKAKIPDITLRGYDMLDGYVFIWGDTDSQAATYMVQIRTGKVIPGFRGKVQNIKPFRYPAKTK